MKKRHMQGKPENVDVYIASFPAEVQRKLEEIRRIIKKAAPAAQEVISYSMPAYKQNGVLVYFAANKAHIGFYPTNSPILAFKDVLGGYKTSKGAIQFPLNQPIPVHLVKDIVKFRIAEDQTKASKVKKKR